MPTDLPSPKAPGRTTAVLVPQGTLAGQPDVPLDRPVTTVGSNENARLHLVSRTVSKGHAIFVNSSGSTYVADMASRTGVLLNGKLVKDAELKTGDRVQIGKFVFRYRTPTGQPPVPPQPPSPGAAVIVVGSAPVPATRRTVLIGRRENCEIIFPADAAVSAAHAVIFQMNGSWHIRDLGSRTGTTVNGKTVLQQELKFGDRIAIGSNNILFQPGAKPAAAPVDSAVLDASSDSLSESAPSLPVSEDSHTAPIKVDEDWDFTPQPVPAPKPAPRARESSPPPKPVPIPVEAEAPLPLEEPIEDLIPLEDAPAIESEHAEPVAAGEPVEEIDWLEEEVSAAEPVAPSTQAPSHAVAEPELETLEPVGDSEHLEEPSWLEDEAPAVADAEPAAEHPTEELEELAFAEDEIPPVEPVAASVAQPAEDIEELAFAEDETAVAEPVAVVSESVASPEQPAEDLEELSWMQDEVPAAAPVEVSAVPVEIEPPHGFKELVEEKPVLVKQAIGEPVVEEPAPVPAAESVVELPVESEFETQPVEPVVEEFQPIEPPVSSIIAEPPATEAEAPPVVAPEPVPVEAALPVQPVQAESAVSATPAPIPTVPHDLLAEVEEFVFVPMDDTADANAVPDVIFWGEDDLDPIVEPVPAPLVAERIKPAHSEDESTGDGPSPPPPEPETSPNSGGDGSALVAPSTPTAVAEPAPAESLAVDFGTPIAEELEPAPVPAKAASVESPTVTESAQPVAVDAPVDFAPVAEEIEPAPAESATAEVPIDFPSSVAEEAEPAEAATIESPAITESVQPVLVDTPIEFVPVAEEIGPAPAESATAEVPIDFTSSVAEEAEPAEAATIESPAITESVQPVLVDTPIELAPVAEEIEPAPVPATAALNESPGVTDSATPVPAEAPIEYALPAAEIEPPAFDFAASTAEDSEPATVDVSPSETPLHAVVTDAPTESPADKIDPADLDFGVAADSVEQPIADEQPSDLVFDEPTESRAHGAAPAPPQTEFVEDPALMGEVIGAHDLSELDFNFVDHPDGSAVVEAEFPSPSDAPVTETDELPDAAEEPTYPGDLHFAAATPDLPSESLEIPAHMPDIAGTVTGVIAPLAAGAAVAGIVGGAIAEFLPSAADVLPEAHLPQAGPHFEFTEASFDEQAPIEEIPAETAIATEPVEVEPSDLGTLPVIEPAAEAYPLDAEPSPETDSSDRHELDFLEPEEVESPATEPHAVEVESAPLESPEPEIADLDELDFLELDELSEPEAPSQISGVVNAADQQSETHATAEVPKVAAEDLDELEFLDDEIPDAGHPDPAESAPREEYGDVVTDAAVEPVEAPTSVDEISVAEPGDLEFVAEDPSLAETPPMLSAVTHVVAGEVTTVVHVAAAPEAETDLDDLQFLEPESLDLAAEDPALAQTPQADLSDVETEIESTITLTEEQTTQSDLSGITNVVAEPDTESTITLTEEQAPTSVEQYDLPVAEAPAPAVDDESYDLDQLDFDAVEPEAPVAEAPASPQPSAAPTGGRPSLFGFEFEGGNFLGGMPIALPRTQMPDTAPGPVTPPSVVSSPAPTAPVVNPNFDSRTTPPSGFGAMIAPVPTNIAATPPSPDKPASAAAITIFPATARPVVRPSLPTVAKVAAPIMSLAGLVSDSRDLRPGIPVIPPVNRQRPVPKPGAPVVPARGLTGASAAAGAKGKNVEVFSQLAPPIGVEVFGGKPGNPDQYPVPDIDKSATGSSTLTTTESPHPDAAPAYGVRRKTRRSRLPILVPLFFILPTIAWFAVNKYLPVSSMLVGKLAFVGTTGQQPADLHEFVEGQKRLLLNDDDIRSGAQAVLAHAGRPPGFTATPEAYRQNVESQNLNWSQDTMQFTLNTPDQPQGIAEVNAVFAALADKDQSLVVARDKARDQADAALARVNDLTATIEKLTAERRQKDLDAQDRPDLMLITQTDQDVDRLTKQLATATVIRKNNQDILTGLKNEDPSKAPDPNSDAQIVKMKTSLQLLNDEIKRAADATDPLIQKLQADADHLSVQIQQRRDELAARALTSPEERASLRAAAIKNLSAKQDGLVKNEQDLADQLEHSTKLKAQLHKRKEVADAAGATAEDIYQELGRTQTELQEAKGTLNSMQATYNNCITVAGAPAVSVVSTTNLRMPVFLGISILSSVVLALMIAGELLRPKPQAQTTARPAAAPLAAPPVRRIPWPQPQQLNGLEQPAAQPAENDVDRAFGV